MPETERTPEPPISPSVACAEGRHADCTDTYETCSCTYRGRHRCIHRYANSPAQPSLPDSLKAEARRAQTPPDVRDRMLETQRLEFLRLREVFRQIVELAQAELPREITGTAHPVQATPQEKK